MLLNIINEKFKKEAQEMGKGSFKYAGFQIN